MKQVKNTFFIAGLFLMTLITTGQAQITIGSPINPVGGALLDLKEREIANGDTTSSDRGLLFLRVKLTYATELYPMYGDTLSENPEYKKNRKVLKAKHIGLTVYNLNDKDGFNPGLHVWNGESWVKPVTEFPVINETNPNLLYLTGSDNLDRASVSVRAMTDNIAGDPDGSAGGSILRFDHKNEIIIPESGAYFFNLRLSGKHGVGTGVYHISLWANGSITNSGSPILIDSKAKDITMISANINNAIVVYPVATFTQPVALGGYFYANDRVYIKIAYVNSISTVTGDNIWQLQKSTSLTWWKL